jgi:hypothetical protein
MLAIETTSAQTIWLENRSSENNKSARRDYFPIEAQPNT